MFNSRIVIAANINHHKHINDGCENDVPNHNTYDIYGYWRIFKWDIGNYDCGNREEISIIYFMWGSYRSDVKWTHYFSLILKGSLQWVSIDLSSPAVFPYWWIRHFYAWNSNFFYQKDFFSFVQLLTFQKLRFFRILV